MKISKKTILSLSFFIGGISIVTASLIANYFIMAWTEPTVPPPGGTVPGVTLDWTDIANRPAGLDDGDDVGTITETDPTVTEASVKNGVTWAEITGTLGGDRITDNTITSSKIQDNTLTFSDTNTASIQRRVTGVCAAGSSIRTVNADGTVVCEADDIGAAWPAGSYCILANGACPAGFIKRTGVVQTLLSVWGFVTAANFGDSFTFNDSGTYGRIAIVSCCK